MLNTFISISSLINFLCEKFPFPFLLLCLYNVRQKMSIFDQNWGIIRKHRNDALVGDYAQQATCIDWDIFSASCQRCCCFYWSKCILLWLFLFLSFYNLIICISFIIFSYATFHCYFLIGHMVCRGINGTRMYLILWGVKFIARISALLWSCMVFRVWFSY